jgi:hypothetical protein
VRKEPGYLHPGPLFCVRNLLQRARAALEKRAFAGRAPEKRHQALAEGLSYASWAYLVSSGSTGCEARNRSRACATRKSKGCLLNQRFASTRTSSARSRSAK